MKQFDAAYIDKELGEIGARVRKPIKVYLIGGCAMSFRKLKESTKDIDIVFRNSADCAIFSDALFGAQYWLPFEVKDEHERLGTVKMYENRDGFHLDLFMKRVCRKMELSKGMAERAEPYKKYGKMEIYLVSKEDIFLFKSLASEGRKRDLADMQVLYPGLDWAAMKKELFSQRLSADLIGHVGRRLEEFRRVYDLDVPLLKELKKKPR